MQPQLGGSYLVKQLLGSTAMTVIYGEAGTGKTFFALWLGLRIAAGGAFFGRRVQRGGVVYIAAEAGRSIENRIAAAKHEFEFPILMPFAAITSPIDLCNTDTDLSRLVALIRATDLGMPIAMIIIDTLSRVLAGGNENAPDDMGALVRNLDRLRDETGAAIAIVHHSGKDTARGARGHSLLRAATDTEIEVSRDEGSNLSTARVTKQRDFATEGSFSFKLRQVEFDVDHDGDPVTSCILEEAESAASPKKPAKLTGAAAVGMEQLRNCLAMNAAHIPASEHVPTGANGVTLDLWRRYLEQAGVINPDGNPREQFRRIRVTLQEHGFIGVWGEFVWASHAVT